MTNLHAEVVAIRDIVEEAIRRGETLAAPIDWTRASLKPVALVLLPWPDGCTIAKEDEDGPLCGCRDVTFGPYYADVVCNWIDGAIRDGLQVKDYRWPGEICRRRSP